MKDYPAPGLMHLVLAHAALVRKHHHLALGTVCSAVSTTSTRSSTASWICRLDEPARRGTHVAKPPFTMNATIAMTMPVMTSLMMRDRSPDILSTFLPT